MTFNFNFNFKVSISRFKFKLTKIWILTVGPMNNQAFS